ncbi:MAG: MBL fold metallo-hydrolase [Chloroflexi bacterium]|nr:MBL fold metallo-hydrolase [Chloroflexota bacterium]
MQVIPGIHHIAIALPGFALRGINVYLVRRDDGWLLIDCGWNTPEAAAGLKKGLQELNVAYGDIRQIIVTHIHPDHFGMVGRLKELSGCSFAMYEDEAKLIDSRYVHLHKLLVDIENFLVRNGAPPEEAASLRNASLPVLKHVVPVQPDIFLHDGDTVRAGSFDFKVLWTPGHSPGHICLYEASHGLLLAGDQVLSHLTPNISLHAQQAGNPLKDYLESLLSLDQLDISRVLPGHGVIFSDFHKRIEELVLHHDQRNEEILGVLDGEPRTGYEIAPRIKWATGGASFQQLPPLDRRLAVLETLSHLEYVCSMGLAQKISADGKTMFKKG